jgi:protein SCO1
MATQNRRSEVSMIGDDRNRTRTPRPLEGRPADSGNESRPAAVVRRLLRPALAAALVMGVIATPVAAAPVTVGGPFTLVAPDGATVTDRTYRGKWLIVYFGFTFCPNTCPTALVEIGTALEKLGRDAADVQPLFITVDPERDTPAVMGEYLLSFDSRIIGLSGTRQEIAAVAEEYGVYYAPHRTGPGSNDYVVDHGTHVYLMDPEGAFVRGFDADTAGERIAEAVRDIMAQWRAEGATRPRRRSRSRRAAFRKRTQALPGSACVTSCARWRRPAPIATRRPRRRPSRCLKRNLI